MPNGGSDCCGTCWFNEKNKGEAGYDHADDPEPNRCIIRDLDIQNPFYTYCANHPHRTRVKFETPVGPVYKGDSSGYREIWVQSPDTEAIRQELLKMLANIIEEPHEEYPLGLLLEDVVIWQLAHFGEKRAIPDLKRIAAFSAAEPPKDKPFTRNNARLVAIAKEALEMIQKQD